MATPAELLTRRSMIVLGLSASLAGRQAFAQAPRSDAQARSTPSVLKITADGKMIDARGKTLLATPLPIVFIDPNGTAIAEVSKGEAKSVSCCTASDQSCCPPKPQPGDGKRSKDPVLVVEIAKSGSLKIRDGKQLMPATAQFVIALPDGKTIYTHASTR